jgi:hypothetical protein
MVSVELACPMPIPAPADTDNAPVEALRLDTTDGVVAEIVIEPAPTPALTIPAPDTTRALFNVPVELLVVLPEADIDTVENTGALFEIVIVLRLDANPIPTPATRDTLSVVPFNVNVAPAPPPLAPIIVNEDAPLFIVMFAPATRDTLEDEPLREKLVATGAEIEIVETLFVSPIAPPATNDALEDEPFSENCGALFEIVIVLALEESDIPAPATRDTLEEDPFNEKLVATGAEIEIVEALLVNPIAPPTTNDALLELPFKENCVAPASTSERATRLPLLACSISNDTDPAKGKVAVVRSEIFTFGIRVSQF